MHCLSQVSTNNVDDNVLEVINFHCLLLTLSPTFCDTIVYNSGKRFLIAYNVCSEVLSQLGENIPETLSSDETTAMTEATLGLVKGITDEDLLGMKEIDSKLATSISFYSLMWRAAYHAKQDMVPFITCRVVQHTMENGLCKHSIGGFITLAALLCGNILPKKDIKSATKIGKAAMSCFTQRYNTSEQIPEIYASYYGFVAWRTEPLQTCTKKHGQGFELSMSLGEPDMAFINSVCQISSSFLAGDKLPSLLEKVDYYLKLADTCNHEVSISLLTIFRGTIAILINGGNSSPFATEAQETSPLKILESMHSHSALRAYWQGHNTRSQHFADKLMKITTKSEMGLLNGTAILFFNGLNSFALMKNHCTTRLKPKAMRFLQLLKTTSEHSSFNFKNKVSNCSS